VLLESAFGKAGPARWRTQSPQPALRTRILGAAPGGARWYEAVEERDSTVTSAARKALDARRGNELSLHRAAGT
jgi:hypothetical protein